MKAKWVRIELRKVETLPGGGPANTFYDFVGPSPVNLWSTSDEYGVLPSVSRFPFTLSCRKLLIQHLDVSGTFLSLFEYLSRSHPQSPLITEV